MRFSKFAKKPNTKIKKEIAKLTAIAVLMTAGIATLGQINDKAQAANLTSPNWNSATNSWNTSGTWLDCNGAVDTDPAHHTLNMKDSDPAHHLGEVCNGTAEAWSRNASVPTNSSAIVTTQSIVNNSQPMGPQMPPAMALSIARAQAKSLTNTNLVTQPPVTTNPSSDPLAGTKLYVNSNNDPSNYVRNNAGSYNAQLMSKIANQPEVEWLGGWNTNVSSDVSNMMNTIDAQGAMPVFVVYNLPNRDCGGYSQGGANDEATYNSWISQIANSIGNRKAAVILEPDGTALTSCLDSNQLTQRYDMLKNAVSTFKNQGNIAVYLDAGHPNWISASDMANRLKDAGINQADGFTLNIANFYTNSDNISYGSQISSLVGGKHFIVDTGRNGSGPTTDNQWCNPSGRSLGTAPTTNTGNSLVDAYLWVKGPGGSDGNCNGGPSAGTFWPDYALGLAQRSN